VWLSSVVDSDHDKANDTAQYMLRLLELRTAHRNACKTNAYNFPYSFCNLWWLVTVALVSLCSHFELLIRPFSSRPKTSEVN